MGVDLLTLAWHRYLQELDRRPLKTKALTAALLAAASDVLAQKLSSSKGSSLNWRRTLSLALYGLLVAAPSSHYWQATLERLFPNKNDPYRSVKKVLLDQVSYGPLANLSFFSFVTLVVEGRSWRAAVERIRHQYPSVQSRGWRVWPIAQFINQEFVPLKLRVLWINLVAFCWSVFLILQAKQALPKLPVHHVE